MRGCLVLAVRGGVEAAAGVRAYAGLAMNASTAGVPCLEGPQAGVLLVEEVEGIRLGVVVLQAIGAIAPPLVVGIGGRVTGMVLVAGHFLGGRGLLPLGERAELAKDLRLFRLLLQGGGVRGGSDILLGVWQYEGVAPLESRAGDGVPATGGGGGTNHTGRAGTGRPYGRCVAGGGAGALGPGRRERGAYISKKRHHDSYVGDLRTLSSG